MAELGVLIEAQEGLTWELWRQLVTDAERLGFAALRTSDHCQSVMGVDRVSLPAWSALTLAAEWTERIQLGPMVSPITFYQPAILARLARAADELASGRIILGVGTGWNEAEHEAFGLPLPPWRERFDLLERGIERIKRTLADHPLPLLIGGGGERRTLTLAAREAAEWNLLNADAEAWSAKSRLLDERCREVGRDPGLLRRSVFTGYLIGRNNSELLRRAARLADFLPALSGLAPEAALEALASNPVRWVVGTPEEIVERLRPLATAGAGLILVQHFLLDDRDALELLAGEVLPAIAAM